MSLCSYSSDTHYGSFLVIENTFINDYLPSAPEFCVKVYLYGLYLCSTPNSIENTVDNMMHILGMTAGEIRDAYEYWQGEGLVQILENTTTNEINVKYLPVHKKLGNSKKFANKYADFNGKIQAILTSRMITPSEFNEYYTLLESFHIDQEALLEIVKYCVALKGTSVSYPYIVTVAKNFAHEGFTSTDAVKERLSAHEEINSEVLNILKVFKTSCKHSTIEERNMYIKWTNELGFAHGVIKEVAKQINKKGGNIQKLDKTLLSYYNANVLTVKDIENYNESRESYLKLAKEITRLLGIYYDNLDIVIETYISDWIRKGYDEDTLKTIATFCFKRHTKTLEGMNNCVLKFYKLGLITSQAINQYMQEIASEDKKIQEILDSCNLLRNVNSYDRDAFHTWTTTWNLSEDTIKLVATYAKDKNQPIQYMNKILAGIFDAKLTTQTEIQAYLDSFGKETKTKKKSTSNYQQREYDQSVLDALFDNLDNIEV